jgi:predicted nucleotidyltransferase
MDDQILSRSEHSSTIRNQATERLAARVAEWADATELGNRICIYTTGSFGRSDASPFSDLDVFIVALEDEFRTRRLSGLEEIELLATIVRVNRELELPALDGDGGFLKVHPLSEYLVGLGKPSDDAENTFTGRLLLLLESKAIFGDSSYQHIRRECVERYWTDYADHADSFLPAFLVNDILRFWRTLCVNYEAGTSPDPAKRRAKNYKLKFSRLLTCFSAIVGIQAEFQTKLTVSVDQVVAILDRTPLERLSHVAHLFEGEVQAKVQSLQIMYNSFLNETNCSKQDLYKKMEDPGYYRGSLNGARLFGDAVFELMQLLSAADKTKVEGQRFFRYITI